MLLRMQMLVFQVHLVSGRGDTPLLSDEVLAETQAQVMTPEQARALGFEGVPDDPNLLLVVVAPKDRRFVENVFDRTADVTGFKVHEVDM